MGEQRAHHQGRGQHGGRCSQGLTSKRTERAGSKGPGRPRADDISPPQRRATEQHGACQALNQRVLGGDVYRGLANLENGSSKGSAQKIYSEQECVAIHCIFSDLTKHTDREHFITNAEQPGHEQQPANDWTPSCWA